VATRAVFFDLYDTLLESRDLKQHKTNAVLAFNQLMIKAEIELSLKKIGQLFDRPVDRHVDDGFTIFDRRISEFLRRSALVHSDKLVRKCGEVILESWDRHWALDPQAEPVLSALQRYGLAIALVTNFDHHPYVRSLVPRLGTNQYFSSLVISGEVGFDKPDPEIFRIALQELSASAENAVHIGDSEVDVLGAQAAGVTPIQILSSPCSNDISGPEDHEVINSLAEVPGLVRTLLGYRGMLIQFALAQVRIPDRPQPLVAD
jgi:HAD superfamily hydrolase (TIGR01509 family)